MSDWQSFLQSRGARAGAGGVSDFGDAQRELAAARDGTIVADLSHNALLVATGDDATAFLHGQFTNDVQHLPAAGAQWNGWCSPKGRLLATFLLVKRADGYVLMLPAEIAAAIAKRLGMFVLRSKVKIEDASARLARFGIAGRDAASLVARHWGRAPDPMGSIEKEGAACVALDAARFVVFGPVEAAAAAWNALASQATPAGMAAWEWTSIRAGIPTIGARTQEEFVPQMANFELVGGVSFKKGCYPGQEIVARTQYRGILKKRLARAHAAGGAPQAGDAVRTPAFGDQAAGMVVNAAPAPGGGHDLLVVAQLEGIAAPDLRLADGTPLELLELPYTVSDPA